MSRILYPFVCLLTLCSPAICCGQTVGTTAGDGTDGYSGDGGPAVEAAVSQPFGIAVGPDNALYVCEVGSHVIRRVDRRTGKITTVAGNGAKGYSGNGGPATDAQLNEPYEVRFDASGNMYFVELVPKLFFQFFSEIY